MNTKSITLMMLTLALAAPAFAQLPADVKSDLGPDVPAFKVRPGFRVTRAFADKQLREARFIQFSEDGKTLYVSQGGEGKIIALTEPDANGVFQKMSTFVSDVRSVQGMCTHDGWLYFSQASEGSISRVKDVVGGAVTKSDPEVIVPAHTLPSGGGHPFEGLLVDDKNIYATASDPQNMTEEIDTPRKTIYVFDLDGKNKQVFCTGIRNTEKLRYRPGTTDIYGFDHGSDNFGGTFGEKMGTDQPITNLNPPEEFNHYVDGAFYGHPFIMGNGVPRPEFAKRPDIIQLADKTTEPVWCVHAHWAVLGFTFVNSDYFPGLKGDVIFCSHGSWNSKPTPTGCCVERLLFDQVTGRPFGSMTIVDCQGPERRWARPVDAAEAA
ncbi:MAG TPA: PQQ-dependent sugar dehydrogenase, partial [Tepidisphaeraceae bacterium]